VPIDKTDRSGFKKDLYWATQWCEGKTNDENAYASFPSSGVSNQPCKYLAYYVQGVWKGEYLFERHD
jgi:hypothetical protein